MTEKTHDITGEMKDAFNWLVAVIGTDQETKARRDFRDLFQAVTT